MQEPGLGAFAHVTVGVTRLDEAIGFWEGNFGFGVRRRRVGADPDLARVFGLPPGGISGQALLASPLGPDRWAAAGNLHLVEFVAPLPPVRRGAGPCDRLPKNLDIYTGDLPASFAALEAGGHRFRSRWGEIPAGDLVFREAHLPGHDELNVVLLEVIGPGYATALSSRGFAGVGPVVTIVEDGAAEARFYSEVLGLATTLELLLEGPAIEATVGLPPGAGLDIRVFGAPAEPLGRIEIIEYQRVAGADLYPRANPPATGILHVHYRVADPGPLRARLARAGIAVTEHGVVDALYGKGPLISFRSPTGFRIEVQG